jgi:hypothetical protein
MTDIGNLTQYLESLNELILTRQLAIEKGDKIWKQGGWNNDVLNSIINKLDISERNFTPKIINSLNIIFNSKAIALQQTTEDIKQLEANPILADKPNGFLGIDFKSRDFYFISNKKRWYFFHHENLIRNPPSIELFCESLSPYFENLYFNAVSIPHYLETLHCKSHIPIMATVMHHLTAIENIFFEIYQRFRAESLPKVCARFQAEMDSKPIPFGCSTDNNGIDSIAISFSDMVSGTTQTIYCDPHTKLWDYLEDGIKGDKGDRIYFSQPINNFLNDKILIGRIGCHN